MGESDLAALTELAVKVRSGEGLDPTGVEACREAIRVARARWPSDAIPRTDVAVLVAFFPDIEAASWNYPDDVRQQIFEAAALLNEELLDAIAIE